MPHRVLTDPVSALLWIRDKPHHIGQAVSQGLLLSGTEGSITICRSIHQQYPEFAGLYEPAEDMSKSRMFALTAKGHAFLNNDERGLVRA